MAFLWESRRQRAYRLQVTARERVFHTRASRCDGEPRMASWLLHGSQVALLCSKMRNFIHFWHRYDRTNQANLVYASIPGAVYEAVWDAECQLLCPLRRSTLLVGTYEAEMNVKPVG